MSRLSLETEGILLLVAAIPYAIYPAISWVFYQNFLTHSWAYGMYGAVWIAWFTKWAVSGGMPRGMAGGGRI